MGIIPLFRICAPQISLQRQLTNVFRLLLASHYIRDGLVHPPIHSGGERYISDNESSSWNFYAGVWEKWRAQPRGWTARMINAKINSAPGNGTNCWDLLIVFEGFLLIIHPERTEGCGVWCWTYIPRSVKGVFFTRWFSLLSHLEWDQWKWVDYHWK